MIEMAPNDNPDGDQEVTSSKRDVDDIDLFPGGLGENPVSGGSVGPTFACILAKQFRNLRISDRFWYETGQSGGFTPDQLAEIRKVKLSKLLCDNGDNIGTIQPQVLRIVNEQNERINCSELPGLNLDMWLES